MYYAENKKAEQGKLTSKESDVVEDINHLIGQLFKRTDLLKEHWVFLN